MIDLRRITRTFPAQERKSPPLPVLSDITLRIPPGQYCCHGWGERVRKIDTDEHPWLP